VRSDLGESQGQTSRHFPNRLWSLVSVSCILSNMKKTKKHHFKHTDPEIAAQAKTTKDGQKVTANPERSQKDMVPSFVYRDLKRTIIIITGFILALVTLYVIQIKTDWLTPVLKVFGI
jgi:hypothetical protein